MEIAIKTYNKKKLKILDTALDKKKEILITTTSDLQKAAAIELYLDNKKYRKYLIKELVPVRAGIVNIRLAFEIDENLLIFSFFDKDNKKIDNVINLRQLNIRRNVYKYLPYSPFLLLVPILIFLGFYFYRYFPESEGLIHNQKEILKENNEEKTEIKPDLKEIQNNKTIDLDDNYTKETLEAFVLENTPVYFVENKSVLLKNEINKINNIIEYFKNYSTIELLIDGHTNSIGKPKNELELSIKRAEFIKKSIESKLKEIDLRISINGNGATKPAAPSISKKDGYLNRRVEINIISAESHK